MRSPSVCLSVCLFPIFVAMQQLGKHGPEAINTYATKEALLDVSFSVQSGWSRQLLLVFHHIHFAMKLVP
jgi:hypothetical protein